MPAQSRWLLVTLLPLWVVCFCLHVYSTLQTGAALPPVFASPVSGDPYPKVGGVRPERASEGLDLLPGDRLLEAGDADLRDVGYVGFYAWTVEQADDNLELPLTIERDGQRKVVRLQLSPTGIPWSRFALWGLGVGLAVLVLLRAPDNRMAQFLFAGMASFSIVESPFTINYELTVLSNSIFLLGGGLSLMLLMRFFLLFPDDMPDDQQIPMGFSWLAPALFYLPRIPYLTGRVIPTEMIPTTILVADVLLAIMVLGIVAWNHAHSGSVGRHRLRGVLWATFIALSPLLLGFGLAQLFPDLGFVRFGIDLAAFTAMGIPAAVFLAIVRHDAFDIDRLISATAAISVSLVVLFVGLLAMAPRGAAWLAERTGLDERVGALAFAVLASVVLVPLYRGIRPRVDALLYPGRLRLERGFSALLAELSGHEPTEALIPFAATRIRELLQAERWVLYSRGSRNFEPVDSSESHPTRSWPLASPAVVTIEAHEGLIARLDEGLSPLERTACDELDSDWIVPFFHRRELDAFLTMSNTGSIDPYSSSLQTLLATAMDKVESERVRREDAVRIAESGERMRSLEAEREEVEAAFLARSHSLATASHDLRQPLHAMGLLVEALASRELEPATRALVMRLGAANESLEEMFTALLDLSRLEAGHVEPDMQPVSLRPLLARVRALVGAGAENKGLELHFETEDLAVRSDPVWLARIVQNLLSNAIRYTERGRVELRVEATEGDQLEIVVADTGPGIPTDQQQLIFTEFHRLEGADRSDEKGLGLGLAIVDRLTRLLGHSLALESRVGEGTVFRLRLPRAPDPAPSPLPAGLGARGLSGLRVVVVDDDPAILEGMTSLLGSWGCGVLAVSGVDELRASLEGWSEEGPPAAAIVDYQLAGERTGFDALAVLRDIVGDDLPALVVTGESDAETLAEIRAAGHPVLTKPVAPARLRSFLQRVDRQARAD